MPKEQGSSYPCIKQSNEIINPNSFGSHQPPQDLQFNLIELPPVQMSLHKCYGLSLLANKIDPPDESAVGKVIFLKPVTESNGTRGFKSIYFNPVAKKGPGDPKLSGNMAPIRLISNQCQLTHQVIDMSKKHGERGSAGVPVLTNVTEDVSVASAN